MKIHSLDPFVLILPLPLLLRVFDAIIEKYLDATKRTGEGETFFSRDKFRTVFIYIYISWNRDEDHETFIRYSLTLSRPSGRVIICTTRGKNRGNVLSFKRCA